MSHFTDGYIAIVGCGFVGSIFATEYGKLAFAGELPRPLRCIDGDIFERRNAANQNVTLAQANTPKAQVVAQELEAYERETDAVHGWLTQANIDELLGGAFLVIDAVDNLATRQLLYNWGLVHQVPVLHLGISQMGTGVIEWSHPQHDTFHLAPQRQAGKPPAAEPASGVLPPCELVRMRVVGWLTGHAGALAAAIFQGFDPMEYLQGQDSYGWMTNWTTNTTTVAPVSALWHQLTPAEVL